MAVSLDQILSTTRGTLEALTACRRDLERAAQEARPGASFRRALGGERLALIAEVKRRSPSEGSIREDLAPVERAAQYADAGASAISVLTDGPYFGGSLEDLGAVSAAVGVPTIRKDFILAEEQILEARVAGASAVLLIVRALTAGRLRELHQFAAQAGLDALVETHTEREVGVALDAGAGIIGVNSRDLDTFEIDVERAWRLFERIPGDRIAVAESGMASEADAERAALAGADGVLVGTALSRSNEPGRLARVLSGVRRRGR
jgi:indole-3-glycerol phosphate synthase